MRIGPVKLSPPPQGRLPSCIRSPWFIVLILFVLVLVNLPVAHADTVQVYAAASTSDALNDVIASYRGNEGDEIVAVYGGSSTLARQIQMGAPADIYISANQAWMDHLAAEDAIDLATRFDGLTNQLVLVAPRMTAFEFSFESGASLGEALGTGRLAMADANGVPAGIYGREALEHFGQWQSVEDKVVYGDSVRAALAWVARAEVPAGIVYETDAAASFSVVVVDRFPADSHASIVYPFAILNDQDRPAVLAFYAYLTGPEAAAIFRMHGFGTVD